MARSARQLAALKKAQLASARKRKGRGRGRKLSGRQKAAIIGGAAVVGAAVAYGGYKAGQGGKKKYRANKAAKKRSAGYKQGLKRKPQLKNLNRHRKVAYTSAGPQRSAYKKRKFRKGRKKAF